MAQSDRKDILNLITGSIKEIFKVSFLGFLIFYAMDLMAPGFVSNFININIFIYISLISGAVTLFFEKENHLESTSGFKKINYAIFLLPAIVSGLIVYWLTKDIGKMSYIVSIASGLFTYLIIIVLSKNDLSDENNNLNNN
ncbi:MAG: hypothetical protein WCV50_00165 [Patescibacteria group bacterium]